MNCDIRDRLCYLERQSRLFADWLAQQGTGDGITYVSSDYQAVLTDATIVADSEDNPITITLPLASQHPGQRITVKRAGVAGSDVSIVPIAPDTVDGSANFQLINDNASVSFRAGDDVWLITATYNTGV